MPCIAAYAATKKELGSLKYAVLTVTYQTVTAFIAGMAIYQIGSLFI